MGAYYTYVYVSTEYHVRLDGAARSLQASPGYDLPFGNSVFPRVAAASTSSFVVL